MGDSVSETARLVANLRNLTWDETLPAHHTTLPPGAALPADFYQSVVLINALTIFGHYVYQSLPAYSACKSFLAYFAAAAYDSEALIWNQRGILQSYYKEGLEWQRGSIVNRTLDRFTSAVPILSSVVVDTLIALSLASLRNASEVLWWGAEQQNVMSAYLFGAPWCWPVAAASNPVVFVNATAAAGCRAGDAGMHPHRLVFGPATWLAMARDVIAWQRASSARPFRRDIQRGQQIWVDIERYLHINWQLLQRAMPKTGATALLGVDVLERILARLGAAASGARPRKLTPERADRTLRDLNRELRRAAHHARQPRVYARHLRRAVARVQHFYCEMDCKACIFVDPDVVCAARERSVV